MTRLMIIALLAITTAACSDRNDDAIQQATAAAYKGGYSAGYSAAQTDQAAYKKGYMDAVECLGRASTFEQRSACVAKAL